VSWMIHDVSGSGSIGMKKPTNYKFNGSGSFIPQRVRKPRESEDQRSC
jgi:hypothetical protein